ncbi:MAG TPA: hypothetical protein VFA20_17790 [Myxococcaceae bacterium]|nr:hypothetical protein [Myxococcaceae bacterium]
MSALRKLAPVLLALTTACSCSHLLARPEDALEPNDDLAHATPLTAGQAVQGRANQGNADVFSLQVPEAGKRLLFRLENRGLENCPAFTVTGPDRRQVLYRDDWFRCHAVRGSRPQPAERVEGAALSPTAGSGYELRVPAAAAGPYFLTISEQGEADNLFPLGWDYQLTAELE